MVITEPTKVYNNDHIREYLDYYIHFPHAPSFAVLLNGPWGIGKTFLIKNILKENFPENKDYAYVSLYGLANFDEIDSALFRAIHPALGWTGTKLAGRVTSIALKYFNITPDVKLSEVLDKFQLKVYIFDDIERSEIPINKVLGYINEFVEHGGCKVIIVGNEAEIADKEAYLRRREKLIGKT
jgi:predicted AAA+ superfamily ATPase